MSICYYEDAQLLVKWTEANHPAFYLDETAPDYERKRDVYLHATKQPLIRWAFLTETMKYLTTLNDGHMGRGRLTPTPP